MQNDKVGVLEGFLGSFNPVSYGKILKQKFSRSFLYLFIIVLFISALLAYKAGDTALTLFGQFIDKVGEEIPEINITNGVVSIPVDQPYVREFEGFAVIIDTTGEIKSLDDYSSGMLVTKNQLIHKDHSSMRTQSYDLSTITKLHLTPEIIKEALKKGRKFFIPILFISMTIYFLIAKLIQVFLFSLASMFINNLKNKKLNYAQLLNIGIYALTPPTLLASIIILADFKFPLFALIYLLFYILILVLAIGKVPPQLEAKGEIK